MSYISVRDVTNTAISEGKGALVLKTDIKVALQVGACAASRQDVVGNEMEVEIYIDCNAAFQILVCSKNIQCDS